VVAPFNQRSTCETVTVWLVAGSRTSTCSLVPSAKPWVYPSILAKEGHAERSGLEKGFCSHFHTLLDATVTGDEYDTGAQWHGRGNTISTTSAECSQLRRNVSVESGNSSVLVFAFRSAR
jgi:hypothetical protein